MNKFTVLFLLSALFLQAWALPKLNQTRFSGPDKTPCPAAICVSATGVVYVGVDMQGSLGKKGGLGKIVCLIDTDNDGVADKHTEYAQASDPAYPEGLQFDS